MSGTIPTIRSLIANGSLVMLHDYRAGHCSALVGGVTADGAVDAVAYIEAAFRTGWGFEMTHDFGEAQGDPDAPVSHGYIRGGTSASFNVPADGCCILASYVPYSSVGVGTGIDVATQVIGRAGNALASSSWALRRNRSNIYFGTTAAAVSWASHTYGLAIPLNSIETIGVRYLGGTAADNSTIHVYSPVASTNTSTINQVPRDLIFNVSVGAYNDGVHKGAMHCNMRYVAYVRGAQTVAILNALQAEIESLSWPLSTDIHCGVSGVTPTIPGRGCDFATGFGIDSSVELEGSIDFERISNSPFHVYLDDRPAAVIYEVLGNHVGTNVASLQDVTKALVVNGGSNDGTILHIPRRPYMQVSSTEAAYGTWDFFYKWNLKPDRTNENVLVDGDMEAVGVRAWTASQSILTKSIINPYRGVQCLRITATAGGGDRYPSAVQTCMTVGRRYLLRCVMTSDGTQVPFIYDGGSVIWAGTSSTAWQAVEVVIASAPSTDITFEFEKLGGAVGTEWIGVDAGELYDITNGGFTQIWPVADAHTGGHGYILSADDLIDDGKLMLRRSGNVLLGEGAAGDVTDGQWKRVRVTRTDAGVWNVYVNDGTAAGWRRVIGPVTDNTYTTSDFMVFHMAADERIDLGGADGERAFRKFRGVWTPV